MKELIKENGSQMFEGWTMEDYIREFRQMWTWIADETEKQKRKVYRMEYLHKRFGEYADDIRYNSFICLYCERENIVCGDCIINWGNWNAEDLKGEYKDCSDEDSPFYDWSLTINWQKAAEYARGIADLPLKKSA